MHMSHVIELAPPADFDFIIGSWRVRHRRLNERLTGCTEWTAFEGFSTTRKILGGYGNVEDNILGFPDGEVRASAVRSYDRANRTWAIWWIDGRNPHYPDAPVIGGFDGTTGLFFADDVLGGRPIKVRFTWTAVPDEPPRWEQAFSPDGGATWETNWTMTFFREDG